MPEVIDAWFDSGSMPFAQWGYPHVEGSEETLEQAYPADFICEAIDQTRGWFYTLMAVGTLVFDESSYRNVLCLGHILAEDGRKMSKHLGNILEPIPLMDEHGADAVRWFMAAGGSPWAARRVGHTTHPGDRPQGAADLLEHRSPSRCSTPAPAGWTARRPGARRRRPAGARPLGALRGAPAGARASPRRWRASTPSAPGCCSRRTSTTCRNWYVRRSRRRFWAGDPAALATLHECLYVVTLLMAPLAPFITERVWQDMFAGDLRGAARVGAPGRLAAASTAAWSTTP